jgi:hypothetical protein
MRVSRQTSRAHTVLVLSLVACSVFAAAARADVLESAKMLPDDTMIMISVESVNGLRAAFEKTSLFGLYKDPALQPLVGEAQKKIRESIDTALKDFWKENKIENAPEQIPFPEGRVVAGLSLAAKTEAEVKAGDDKESEEQAPGDPGLDIHFALLADMGSKAGQVKQLMRSLSARATDKGTTVQRQELAGVEMDTLIPPKESDSPAISYGMKDNWLIVTADTSGRTDFTESVARRVGRALPGSLRDKPGFAAIAQSLGAAPIFAFVNADAIRVLVASKVKNKDMADKIVKGLGLGNVTGLASAVQIAPQKNQDLCAKALLAVQGPKTGLPALLEAASSPLKLNNRLLTRDAVGFLTANYEPLKLFDDLARMVGDITGVLDLNMMVQSAMMPTAKEAGQPQVQVRDEVLANVTSPVLMTWKIDKAGQSPLDPLGLRFLVALPVRDGARLNTALGRIHQAFLDPDGKLRREMLNRTLYVFPAGGAAGAGAGANATSPNQIALAVAGDHLVIGQVGEVEQAIRSLQKEPENPLAADPMFRYAREYLPAQAGAYYYRNDRLNAESSWTMIKEALRNLQSQLQNAPAGDAADPMAGLLKEVSAYVDLGKLPEFRAVEKYFGATVGFMQSRPDGLYWESTVLKPAPQ